MPGMRRNPAAASAAAAPKESGTQPPSGATVSEPKTVTKAAVTVDTMSEGMSDGMRRVARSLAAQQATDSSASTE